MLHALAFVLAAAGAQTPSSPACSKAVAFTGTICTPAGPGKHPAILLLGGSEGGDMMSHSAPQFAQRGYVAASVAYFGMPGLPQTLQNVPVETIGKAIDDISKRSDVDANHIAIFGGSKGGELALLAASIYPQIHAVVADVPSPFAWEGIPQGPGPSESSWTVNGKPLPYVHYTPLMGQIYGQAFADRKPLDLRKGYDDALQANKAQMPGAMFRLENIHGPVLLIGADDDQIWNSNAQSQIALQYLRDHHHPYADAYVHYNAGHIFLFAAPGRPMTQAAMGPVTLLFGGTPQTNVDAARQAWPQIGSFLGEAWQAPGKS